jgi:hypothetical protein
MGGGGKQQMKDRADEHFEALKQIIPTVRRLMLFDLDRSDDAFHPTATNPTLAEWKRKNIENYLLVPDAWIMAALRLLDASDTPLFAQPVIQKINDFFAEQNLTLPPGKTWRRVAANVFAVVDGKRILFENHDSLFHKIEGGSPPIKLIREEVAMSMTVDQIHEDVHQFIAKLIALTES